MLLLCVRYILRLRYKLYRLVLASISSAIISTVALLPIENFLLDTSVTALSCGVAVLICFGCGNRRLYIKTTLTLLAATFLLSGAMIFLYLGFSPGSMIIINNRPYFDISPLLLIILTAIVYVILFIFKKFFRNHTMGRQLHTVRLNYKGESCEVPVKEDSACNVKEPFSGSSVIIVEKSALPFYPDKDKRRIIPFESLGGNGIIYGFRADSVYIDNNRSDSEIYIGLCDGIFKDEIKGLVPDSILKG